MIQEKNQVKTEGIRIYEVFKRSDKEQINEMKRSIKKYSRSYFNFAKKYVSNLSNDENKYEIQEEIRNYSISFLSSLKDVVSSDIYMQDMFLRYNREIKSEALKEIFQIDGINNQKKKIENELSEDELNKNSDIEISKKVAFWSNKLAKISEAIFIRESTSLFSGNEKFKKKPEYNDKYYSNLFEKIYVEALKYQNGFSLKKLNDFSKFVNGEEEFENSTNKNLIDIMEKYEIPKNKVKTFVNCLLLKQANVSIYNIKQSAILNMISLYMEEKQKGKDNGIRIYKKMDEKETMKVRNNNMYRLIIASKGDFSPTVLHVPKNVIDDFEKDKELSILEYSSNSSISKYESSVQPFNYKVDSKQIAKLEKIKDFSKENEDMYRRICPSKEEIKQEKGVDLGAR